MTDLFSLFYYETPDLVFIVTDVTVLHLKVDIFMHTKYYCLPKHQISETLKFILKKSDFLWGKLMLKMTSQ